MAYTKTLIGDVREHGFTDYDSEKLQGVVETINTNFTSIEQTITNIEVEGTADAVGAMLTGNTETGITVSYQDSDNTLDFEVAYGNEAPGDVGTGTAAVGVANAAARADHNHNLAAHDHETLEDLGAAVPVDGSGCTLDTTVDGGALDTAVVNAAGSGYQVDDVLQVAGGAGGTVTVATVDEGGVATVTVTVGGSGYSAATGAATTTTSTRAWTATNMAALTDDSTVVETLQAINDDLVEHGHDLDYQEICSATTTLGDLGLPVPDPAYSGVLTGITVSSTLAQLLAAIDSHTHT